MWNPFKTGIEWIVSQVTEEGVTSDILEKLKGFFGQIAATVQNAIAEAMPAASIKLLTWMLEYIQAVRGGVLAITLSYVNLTTGSELTRAEFEGENYKVISDAVKRAYAEHPLKYMLNLIMPEGPLTPEKGMEGAENFLNVNMAFQLDAWILHLIGDVSTLGHIKSLKDLPNAISWSFGIGWLSWLVMGTPFRIGIADPLERLYNSKYRPALPNERELAQMWIMDFINGKEYYKLMGQKGWSDERAEFLYNDNSDKLSRTQIRDLYQAGIWDKNQVDQALRWLGYNKKFREQAKFYLFNERLLDLKEDLLSESERAFSDGRMSQENFENILENLGWSPEEISLKVTVAQMKANRRRDLPKSDIDEALELGIISEEEWENYYLHYGYTPEDVQLLISKRKYKETVEKATQLYWQRRQSLVSRLNDAGIEDYWSIAREELGTRREDILRIGQMSTKDWINLMNSIVEKYK